jgi:hypothetical protein
MAKLFIPACGDRLTLAAPWEFKLYLERRNLKFAEMQKLITEDESTKATYGGIFTGKPWDSALRVVPATLPAGTVLECDRVYIKTFNKSRVKAGGSDPSAIDYDSITWKMMKGEKAVKSGRFWCKLSDACEIEFTLDTDAFYRDRVKVFRQIHES